MIESIKKRYRTARLFWRFLTREELKAPAQMSPIARLSYLRRGYLSQCAMLYNLTDYRLEEYFSDWDKARMSMMYDARNIRAGYQYGLNNKIFSTALLGQRLRVPTLFATVEDGRVVPLGDDAQPMARGLWTEACRCCGGALVLKPSAGSCGRGVLFLSIDGGTLLLNGSPILDSEMQRQIATLDEYIVVEFLRQGRYAAGLYPEATNTIRMVTMIDPLTGQPCIPIAVQRIGRALSKPVDNWFQSGLSAEVDLTTGVLSRAAAREGPHRLLKWHDNHPDTGAPIKGVTVPDWSRAKETILSAAARMAYFKFMSWDVVTLDDGIAVLEADTVSAIDLLQVHRPLLRDERLRRFLEHHGFVKPRRGSRPATTPPAAIPESSLQP